LTIDVDFESANDGVELSVDLVLLSLLRRVWGVRCGVAARQSSVVRGITVRREGLGGLWKASTSSSCSDPSTMVSGKRMPPSPFLITGKMGESLCSPLSVVAELSSVSDDEQHTDCDNVGVVGDARHGSDAVERR
jgi:hypothetical protein